MRALNKNEKRLLGVFLGLIFIMVNFFVLPDLSAMQKRYKLAIASARSDQKSDDFWLKNKVRWQGRKVWMDAHQPKLTADGDQDSAFLESLQKRARELKITIVEQSLVEPKSTPSFQELAVKLKVTASLENLTKWVAELQNPQLFQAITSFSLKSDAEPPNVKCEMQVARWYAPKNP